MPAVITHQFQSKLSSTTTNNTSSPSSKSSTSQFSSISHSRTTLHPMASVIAARPNPNIHHNVVYSPHQHHNHQRNSNRTTVARRPSASREEHNANTTLRKKYLVIRQLGSGSMGKVFHAIDNQSRNQVAVKVVLKPHLQDKNDKLALAREVNVLQNMDHPNIVGFRHAFEDSNAVYLATEYCANGDLYKHLYKSKHGIPEREALKYMRQIFQAMAYLNSKGISHRDIKPENVLLMSNGRVKLADFGMCFWRSPGGAQTTNRPCGTPQYSSPEIMRMEKYVPEKSDVWSCGVMLYALLTRTLPFTGEGWSQLRQQIVHADVDSLLRSRHAKRISTSCKKLIKVLLVYDPKQRPSPAKASDLVDDVLLGVRPNLSKKGSSDPSKKKNH